MKKSIYQIYSEEIEKLKNDANTNAIYLVGSSKDIYLESKDISIGDIDIFVFVKNGDLQTRIVKEIENIGRTLYKENFIDIFFYNSLCGLVGFTVKNDLQYREDVFLIPLLLEIIMMCPIKHLFKIEED